MDKFKRYYKQLITIGAVLAFAVLALSARGQEIFSPGKINGEHREKISKCSACHKPFQGAPDSNCLHCHKRVATQEKEHRGLHGGVIGDCSSCHHLHQSGEEGSVQFDKSAFSHSLVTAFALNQHPRQKCSNCHKQGYNVFDANACLTCHSRRARDERFTNHILALGSGCLECHTGRGAPKFKHKRRRNFFLGKHQTAACAECHEQKSYTPVSAECRRCHKQKHRNVNNTEDCQRCHSSRGWKELTFNHGKSNCADCHGAPINHSRNTRISAAAACQNCHQPKGWKQVKFAHKNSDCTKCHAAPANHFGNDCRACHNTKDWRRADFNHPSLPGEAGEKHSWRSFPCNYCHPQGYRSYSCLRCHNSNNVFDD